MKNYESLIEALRDLKARSYTQDFELEATTLHCLDLNIRLKPEEFTVEEVYRFEGDSDPDESSVLYAISSSQGTKGTLIDAFGVYAENLTFDMARKLQTTNRF
jgi:hypothetical protein